MSSTPKTKALFHVLALILIALWFVLRTMPQPEPEAAQEQKRQLQRVERVANEDPKDPADRFLPISGEAAKAALRQNGSYASLGEALAAARHAVERIDPAGEHARGAEYFAANPGEHLRAWFSGGGVELASGIPTPDGEEPWSLKLRLVGLGRGAEVVPVVPGPVSGEGGRIEIEHSGAALTQWFENREEGVEQGFTIETPPVGGSGEVVVLLAAEGSLQVEDTADDGGVRFVDGAGGEVLTYSGLKAWDAAGRDLPARMEVRGSDELALVVRDAGAEYPVTIDPLFANVEARLIPESTADDRFGNAVALWDDTAVIGAHEDDTMAGMDAGSAYVFVREDSNWSQQATLTIADGVEWGRFGHDVAIAEDTAVVGAPANVGSGAGAAGCAYVFVRNGAEWSQQGKLTAADGESGDKFGSAVAVSGGTALIGAPEDDSAVGLHSGSAYVFERSGTTWSAQAKLTASDEAGGDQFGHAVALAGSTALVGAPLDNTSSGSDAGSAYVFVRGGGTWSEQTKLAASDAAWGDKFGTAVALSGETALVGAAGDDTADGRDAGSAYVFVRSGIVWSQQAKLTAGVEEADEIDYFGCAVALSGDLALIGAWQDATPAGPRGGSAYVFERSGMIWKPEAKLTAGFPTHGDEFGAAVAVSGDRALVGAYRDDTSAGIDAGSAYVFVRSGGTWSQEELLTTEAEPSDDRFGDVVAASEDTVVVGVPRDDTMVGANAGSAYVFGRSGSLWHQEAKLSPLDGEAGDYFGKSVAISGGTALVGAPYDDRPGGMDAGSAHVFTRNGVIWSYQGRLTEAGGEVGDNFGSAVAVSGETALVAASRDDTEAGDDSGSVRVFLRSGAHWSPEALLTPDPGSEDVQFGFSVAVSGDTALVGTPRDDSDPAYRPLAPGSAYVFVRSGSVWSQQARLAVRGGGSSDFSGNSVALSGETALIGAPFDSKGPFEDGFFEEGSAHLFVRDGTTWNLQARLTAADVGREDNFGDAVALSGDIALVGVPRDETTAGAFAGSAYVFSRDGTLWHQEVKLTAGVDASARDWFGSSVALDGNTAVAGSPYEGINGEDAGSVYVFLLGELPEITAHPVSRTVPLTDPGTPVTFTVAATGEEPMFFEWRKNGAFISGASGTLADGATSHTIPGVTEADAGFYDVLVWNAGGSVTSSPASLAVNVLSEFGQSFPGAPAAAQGLVLVNLVPSGIGGAWRFVGEQRWRASGTAALGVTTSDRVIEFRPVPGFIHPPAEVVSVVSGGAATVLERGYYQAGAGGIGGVNVTLKPDALADPAVPESDRAQWRFLGEDGSQWRDTGTTVSGLVPGNYLIECKPVAGRTTPAPANVLVVDGHTAAPILTYFLEGGQTGTGPVVLGFELVSAGIDLPYAYVGQIRSDVGASTGFVVKERVVATAGHVVFDDGTLSAVTGLQWLFQRDWGRYEPQPETPRGFYLFDGYSAQRAAEGTPGVSSPASQELDVAALYFDQPAGRGGFGGFLASDAVSNEWVSSDAQKILVGYPVEGVPATHAGRMHATPAMDVSFTAGGSPHTYTTSDIRSGGGNSGGPLCVQFEGGPYYPAAIYLGGTGQTVVRVIDSEVIRLFEAAEDSAATGNNNTGGGITLTSVTPVGTPADPGVLTVTIEPSAARAAGAGWRLVPESTFRPSGAQKAGLSPGGYRLELAAVPGFEEPGEQLVQVAGGSVTEVIFTYAAVHSEREAWRLAHFGTIENTGDAADDADPDGDGDPNSDEFVAGTDPNDRGDFLEVDSMSLVGSVFTMTTEGKAGRIYELQIAEDLQGGVWTTRATEGPLAGDGEVVLTDGSAPGVTGIYRIRVTKP